MAKKNTPKEELRFPVNDEIRYLPQVRIVGDNVESKVIPLNEAKRIAESMELDLALINTQASPPIVRVCNYEKMIYEMKRNQKKQKSAALPVKEVQLSVNIASNDLQTKAKQAKSFLEHGHKVKVVLTIRGRDLGRREESKRSILEFIVMLEDVSKIESLRDEGNKTIAILKKK
jgi:translation initiation factor IF-3